MKLPNTRADLLVQDLSDEVLIYDLKTDKSYCLNSTAKTVFNACNGKTTLDELKVQTRLSEDIIFLALDEIKKNDLLKDEYVSPFAGMNRREVIRKVGLASMVALPMIAALIAPPASMAASGACVAPNTGGAAGGSPTATSGDVATLKASCQSCCYRDYNPQLQQGTCCTSCGDARCQ